MMTINLMIVYFYVFFSSYLLHLMLATQLFRPVSRVGDRHPLATVNDTEVGHCLRLTSRQLALSVSG
jgi:hypothetical protein